MLHNCLRLQRRIERQIREQRENNYIIEMTSKYSKHWFNDVEGTADDSDLARKIRMEFLIKNDERDWNVLAEMMQANLLQWNDDAGSEQEFKSLCDCIEYERRFIAEDKDYWKELAAIQASVDDEYLSDLSDE